MFSWIGRKVALTGATGFLGRHVATELRSVGADVVALTRASSSVDRLKAIGVRCVASSLDDVNLLARDLDGCDLVIHMAGKVSFENEWEPYYRVNVAGTRNVLAAARKAGVRRLVHTSSIVAVGGSHSRTLLDERAVWNLGSNRVPYVTTKRWAEEEAIRQCDSDFEVVVVNPGSIVGPNDFAGSEFGTVCRRFWNRELPICFRGGNNYVDVRDVARGICLAAERGRPHERYLLTGENRTHVEFFRDLACVAGRSIPFLQMPLAVAGLVGWIDDFMNQGSRERPFLSSAQASMMGLYFYYDSQKARDELGFQSRPLRHSLRDAFEFWSGTGIV